MSKFYMIGTELQELEALMMRIPNFLAKRSGMTIMKKSEVEITMNCKSCDCSFNQCQSSNFGDGPAERLVTRGIDYQTIVRNCFKDLKSIQLEKRLDNLMRNYDDDIFLNEEHRARFLSICRLLGVSTKQRNSYYLATLFLLTADDNLWSAAKDHIYIEGFDFKRMQLIGITTYGYALYQTARTIYLKRVYIKLDEIADKSLIGDQTFKVIINAILLSKYASEILNMKYR